MKIRINLTKLLSLGLLVIQDQGEGNGSKRPAARSAVSVHQVLIATAGRRAVHFLFKLVLLYLTLSFRVWLSFVTVDTTLVDKPAAVASGLLTTPKRSVKESSLRCNRCTIVAN
jgi:hypothetical protein